MTPLIFVTGGVVSSLGKGIAAASLASILEARGLSVTMMKLEELNGEQRMYVGTYNQSTKKGSVYTMTVDPTNGSVISDIHQYTGFNRVCEVFIKHM